MDLSFLNYILPDERIAQRPIGKGEKRSSSQLLHAVATSEEETIISDRRFSDLTEILRRGDVLVVNNSQVLPSRFFIRPESEKSEIEVLFIKHCEACSGDVWEVLARPMKRLKVGSSVQISQNIFAEVLGRSEDGNRMLLRLSSNTGETGNALDRSLQADALMPIPPYIRGGHADDHDRESYQTVFAQLPGSIAAPTAGLHFTPELLAELAEHGVQIVQVTLHVGSASFIPIREGDVSHHEMATEQYSISPETCDAIWKAKRDGRRVVVVGTTCTRALESAVRTAEFSFLDGKSECHETEKDKLFSTQLFITPGFEFRVVDALITNFHQPLSTHLLLVASFIGGNNVTTIYEHALAGTYRFLSYGDGMLLEKRR